MQKQHPPQTAFAGSPSWHDPYPGALFLFLIALPLWLRFEHIALAKNLSL